MSARRGKRDPHERDQKDIPRLVVQPVERAGSEPLLGDSIYGNLGFAILDRMPVPD
jgi:hypothetical protein